MATQPIIGKSIFRIAVILRQVKYLI